MTVASVRLNDVEYEMMKQYADLHGKSLSTMLKEALEEKIENDFDMAMIAEYEQEENPELISLNEMRAKYEL